MSDAVTNIDDFVTSFRRLVAAPAPAIVRPPAPRLVLTREQRIDLPAAGQGAVKGSAPRLATLILMNPLNVDVKPAVAQAPEVVVERPQVEVPPAVPTPSDLAERRQKLEDTIAELEAAVCASDTDWEPDGSEIQSPVSAAQASPIRSALLEAARYVPKAPAKPSSPAAQSSLVEADTPAVDSPKLPESISEAYLRRLVAEIVRAELQGALGERATANVRKLVREEIDAALRDCEL